MGWSAAITIALARGQDGYRYAPPILRNWHHALNRVTWVPGSRFWTAKNAPGFGPLGPYLVTMDNVADPYNIWVTCRVNGAERMRVYTSEQIWTISAILAHFSRLVPLLPGDMFSTGAPGGVAVGKSNAGELFLKPGDVVECAFEHPAMVLSNRIVADH